MAWRLPFVSRGRFEDLQERYRASEEERKRITDELLAALGKPRVFSAPQPVPVIEPPADTSEKREVLPMRGRPSPADIRQFTTASLTRKAQMNKSEPLPPPPVQEVTHA